MSEQDLASAGKSTAESNGLGLAGFIISLVGLCSGGILSPIGLILSFVAMFREPRGFAIAGFVLGLLGSAWILIAVVFIGFAAVAATVMGVLGFGYVAELYNDGRTIREALLEYEQAQGSLPASIDAVAGRLDEDDLEDFWGRRYRVVIDAEDREVRIFSNGPDGKPDTGDDLNQTLSLDDSDQEIST